MIPKCQYCGSRHLILKKVWSKVLAVCKECLRPTIIKESTK